MEPLPRGSLSPFTRDRESQILAIALESVLLLPTPAGWLQLTHIVQSSLIGDTSVVLVPLLDVNVEKTSNF